MYLNRQSIILDNSLSFGDVFLCDEKLVDLQLIIISPREDLQYQRYQMYKSNMSEHNFKPLYQKRDKKQKVKHRLEQLKNIQLSSHKKIIIQQQELPEIQSPFLKKAVFNLFSSNNSKLLSPIYGQEKRLEPIKLQLSVQKEKTFHKIFNRVNFFDETSMDNKKQQMRTIIKSFSQSKNTDAYLQGSCRSKQLAPKYPKHSIKIPTQGSLSSSASSKQLYERINELKTKDSLIVEEERQKQGENGLKEYKRNSFVFKQKIAQQLYNSQKEQIKYVKSFLKDRVEIDLGKSLKIKNYTNFFPNIINIQP